MQDYPLGILAMLTFHLAVVSQLFPTFLVFLVPQVTRNSIQQLQQSISLLSAHFFGRVAKDTIQLPATGNISTTQQT